MAVLTRESEAFLYQQVLEKLQEQIRSGGLRPGDKLPSLRRLAGQLEVSIPTVRQAYLELESQGDIIARPKSGYFVRARPKNPLVSGGRRGSRPKEICCRDMIEAVYEAIHKPGILPLGIANPCMALPATKTLNRAMKRVMNQAESRALSYAPTTGDPGLKQQLAYHLLNHGTSVPPEDIIITNGAQEAMALALKAVAKPGDLIAVETPTYVGMLELIDSLDMRALEIDTCAEEGVTLSALSLALDRHPIAACLFSSVISNPLGCATDDRHRQELVRLLEDRDVPLIEDDVYGELLYERSPVHQAQAYSRKGLVLTCGSFSKTAAPGYRIGWLLPGRYAAPVKKIKRAFSCSSGLLQQLTLAEFMASGDYERYLHRLVPILKCNSDRMAAAVARSFPEDTRVSRPGGGSVLWLELNEKVDSEVLFDEAIGEGISIIPGTIFSPDGRYRNFIRLSFGHPWSEAIENGVETIGRLVTDMVARTDAGLQAAN